MTDERVYTAIVRTLARAEQIGLTERQWAALARLLSGTLYVDAAGGVHVVYAFVPASMSVLVLRHLEDRGLVRLRERPLRIYLTSSGS